MATIKEQLRDFLEANNYLMSVRRIKNGCELKIPVTKDNKPSYVSRLYKVKSGPTLTVMEKGFPDEAQIVEDCPDYAIRVAVLSDILLICKARKYDLGCLKLLDANGQDKTATGDLLDVMPPPKSRDAQQLEARLMNVFLAAYADLDFEKYKPAAEKLGVESGFDRISKIFQEDSNA